MMVETGKAGYYRAPIWSPDGTWIAITREGEAIAVRTLDGIVQGLGQGSPIAWSPENEVVLAKYDQLGFQEYLHFVNPESGEETREAMRGNSISWSPDGTKFAIAH